jgi:hypothetical protein
MDSPDATPTVDVPHAVRTWWDRIDTYPRWPALLDQITTAIEAGALDDAAGTLQTFVRGGPAAADTTAAGALAGAVMRGTTGTFVTGLARHRLQGAPAQPSREPDPSSSAHSPAWPRAADGSAARYCRQSCGHDAVSARPPLGPDASTSATRPRWPGYPSPPRTWCWSGTGAPARYRPRPHRTRLRTRRPAPLVHRDRAAAHVARGPVTTAKPVPAGARTPTRSSRPPPAATKSPDADAEREARRRRDAVIVRRYSQGGVSMRVLAASLGVSYGTVHRVLTANNVPKHSRGCRAGRLPTPTACHPPAATAQP